METQISGERVKVSKESDVQMITPFLWFNNQAGEAVNFYTNAFKNSKIKTINRYGEAGAKASRMPKGSVMTIAFELEGYEFVALNGGPVFQITPSISFFVNCPTEQEIDMLWTKLSKDGKVMMELDKYPFSDKYGWIQDQFGVSWQLILSDRIQKITPCLMFTGKQHLKAEEAINFYISIFENSKVIRMERYQAGQGPEGAIVHGKFSLHGQEFIAMDSHQPTNETFNPAVSFVISCATQDEIDNYWERLSEGGDEDAQQCGWLQDKYGVSWQIVPVGWDEIMKDPTKSEKGMNAVLQMKKIDINAVMKAME